MFSKRQNNNRQFINKKKILNAFFRILQQLVKLLLIHRLSEKGCCETNSRKHPESKERMSKSRKFMMEVEGHKMEGRDVTLYLVDSYFVLFCIFHFQVVQKRDS